MWNNMYVVIDMIEQCIFRFPNIMDNYSPVVNRSSMPRILFLHAMNCHLHDNECLFMACNLSELG